MYKRQRENRGQFASTPKHELYLSLEYGPFDTDKLLEGSFQFVEPVAEAYGLESAWLKSMLHEYVDNRLVKRKAHDRTALKAWLVP